MIGMQRRRREPLFKEVVTIVRFRLAESCGRERGVKAARRALAGEDVKIARTVYEPSIHAVDVVLRQPAEG